jgi:hypothetical protein
VIKQVLVVFHLGGGSELDAARLAAAELPFDAEQAGFKRLTVYVTHREAIFVLEGEEPEWREEDPRERLHPAAASRTAR